MKHTEDERHINQVVGENLSEQRRLKGLSIEELAARVNLDRSYIGEIERGERNSTVDTLARIANSLDVSVLALLEGSELYTLALESETYYEYFIGDFPETTATSEQECAAEQECASE